MEQASGAGSAALPSRWKMPCQDSRAEWGSDSGIDDVDVGQGEAREGKRLALLLRGGEVRVM